jgi:predicted methyltransferase
MYTSRSGMKNPIILSHFQVDHILSKWEIGQKVEISADLGLSTLAAQVEKNGLRFPNGEILLWGMAEKISSSEAKCFSLRGGEMVQVSAFSEDTDRVYSLMPTEEAPTLLISGIPMHRIKGTTPNRDTSEKIKAINPVVGDILDTATGLGYTAIEASKSAKQVTTIEFDPVVLEIAQLNPWSQDLFTGTNITQIIGDSFNIIEEFASERFTVVIHDPPTFSLAGDLYSKVFYESVYRVLRINGRLFHYIGNPESRSGRRMTDGVIRRLRESGFSRIRRAPQAFGVTAQK